MNRKNTEVPLVRMTIAKEAVLGKTVCRYVRDHERGCLALVMVPCGTVPAEARETIEEPEMRFGFPAWCSPWAWEPESLIQVRYLGDALPDGYAQGMTMRSTGPFWNVASIEKTGTRVVVSLTSADGRLAAEHCLTLCEPSGALKSETKITNTGTEPLMLEMLSSFSLDGVTPFAADDAGGRLVLHRARAAWSAEGVWKSRSLESLGLERSWQGHAVRCERFGQVGSLPVRGWFPCAIVEDTAAGVSWGAQLVAPGSWQMEIYRRGDKVAVSGGIADYEFGHWRKTLAPGESFAPPPALVAVCRGGRDEAAAMLVRAQANLREAWNETETSLPVVFNEFCSSWGNPTSASLAESAAKLKGAGVTYCVIDAGWYSEPDVSWAGGHGDWVPSATRFPGGLRATAEMIRAHGLVPGIWFEPETVGVHSAAFHRTADLLTRDGVPVTVGGRRFWDLRKPAVFEALVAKVTSIVAGCGFGYVKFDYNETIGIGADGAESPGEGLRQQMAAAVRFYRRLRHDLPGVVFEFCASGGHRIEPGFLALADMVSFSDAHESRHIPVLAAAQHFLAAPRQLQIWAVLRNELSDAELRYALAGGFLGRLCISGNIAELAPAKWQCVREALALYRECADVIRDGTTRIVRAEASGSTRHPRGEQVVLRTSADGARALVVAHRFSAGPSVVTLPGEWEMLGGFAGGRDFMRAENRRVAVSLADAGSCGVWLLRAAGVPREPVKRGARGRVLRAETVNA